MILIQSNKLPKIYDNSKNQIWFIAFGGGCIGLDRIKTNNQERIINNRSKQVQPVIEQIKTVLPQKTRARES